jgi:hypothetical protein
MSIDVITRAGLGTDLEHAEMDANLNDLALNSHLTVLSKTTDLPGSPTEGDCYIVPSGTYENKVAVYRSSSWKYYTPTEGWRAWIVDIERIEVYASGAWAWYPDLELGETDSTAYRGDRGKTAYEHSQVAHAPSTAQKNSDILKSEIEAKLIGEITSHGHAECVDIPTLLAAMPAHYQRDVSWAAAGNATTAERYTLVSPGEMAVNIGGAGYRLTAATDIVLSSAASWDDTTTTDWTVAANRAGQDFYIYACQQSGTVPKLVLSANSAVPTGYTSATSRKIGGFHGLCADVGTIADHPLSDYAAGDILPASPWDLNHRPACSPEGMVHDAKTGLWVDIYLASGTGSSTASAYGGTISDSRNWMDFVDDFGAVGKRLLTDHEFQNIAAGSNEQTNIAGSVDPVTTGGHSDTAGRRMISYIGCEDCCGALYQWLLDQSYRYDGGSHDHGDPTYDATNVDPSPAWEWYDLPGSRGSIYRQGSYGDVKLRAGGPWGAGSICGSRARSASGCRWGASSNLGGRGCAWSRNT